MCMQEERCDPIHTHAMKKNKKQKEKRKKEEDFSSL